MINVKTSKGIFQITRDLFESILKNTPELLMEDNPSANIFDIKKRYQDATGLTYNPNGDMFNALIKVMEKTGGDPEEFQKELQRIYAKSDNNENNFKENLGKILKGKEIQDYRPKTNIKNQSSKKENEREIFIDTIKGLVGEDNFNKLPYSELNNWFEKWNKKDTKGKEKIYSEIGKELSQRFSEEKPIEQTIEQPKGDMVEEKPIENNKENKESIKEPSEEKIIEKNKKKKFHKKNKKPIENNNVDENISINDLSIISDDKKEIEELFNISLQGKKWNMTKKKFLSFVISMYKSSFNNDKEIKKLFKNFNEQYNNDRFLNDYLETQNKKGLIHLFNKVKNECDTKQNVKDEEDSIENINTKFKEYLKQYDGMDAPRIDKFIKLVLLKYIPEKYVDEALKRYMSEFKTSYEYELSDKDLLEWQKEDMKNLYTKVINDCEKLKKFIDKNNKKEEPITEQYLVEFKNNINDQIYHLFAQKGMEYIENNESSLYNKILSSDNKKASADDINSKLIHDEINKSLREKMKEMQSSYLTNLSIDYLIKLYNRYKTNYENEKDNRNIIEKEKLENIARVYNTIKESYRILKSVLQNNELNEQEINKEKNKMAYKIRRSIIGLNKEDNFNKINDFSIDDFNKWYKEKESKIETSRNLLNYLTDKEWDEFSKTFDYPLGSTEKSQDKNKQKIVERITDIVSKVSFDSEIPHIVTNFINELLNGSIKNRVLSWTYKIYPMGFRHLDVFSKEIKKYYVDMSKNDGNIYRDLKVYDVFRSIPEKEFWKNVCVISCYTENSFNIIGSSITQLNRRNELYISTEILTTGLKTRSRLFILTPKNNEGKMNNRNGGKLFNEKDNINSNDQKLINEINRRYFILLTEGYFKVGNTLNKMYRGLKNITNNKNNLLGVDTSNMHYK